MAALRKEEMLNLAENAVRLALAKGGAEAEAYLYDGQTTSIGIERGQITKSNRIIDRGLGIRVVINKTVGFAYTNVLEKRTAIDDTVLRAVGAARASKSDPDWHGLPAKRRDGVSSLPRAIARTVSDAGYDAG